MSRIRTRGEEIRHFIIENVEKHPHEISKVTAQHFGITRQAVSKHLQRLTKELALAEVGNTRSRSYKLSPLLEWRSVYEITPSLAEDLIWTNDISPVIGRLPENVLDIWRYGFTEMFNNAIDHSGGKTISVQIKRTAKDTEMMIGDDGIGIFKKIQMALNLLDERHAILELSKGKLTTDPKKHAGEGIFFTSRMVDFFDIMSGGVYFSHLFGDAEDWISERPQFEHGTAVWMKLDNHTARREEQIFNKYSIGDDYGFNKTVVPVKLAQYGTDKLVSRSQAKRLLARVELFKVVVFNFKEVPNIGQAFADEIFRVFATAHPEIELVSVNTSSQVKRMIDRAKSGNVEPEVPEPTDSGSPA